MKKTIIRFKYFSAIGTRDNDRAILPTLMYTKSPTVFYTGHVFVIGWWALDVGFIVWRVNK